MTLAPRQIEATALSCVGVLRTVCPSVSTRSTGSRVNTTRVMPPCRWVGWRWYRRAGRTDPSHTKEQITATGANREIQIFSAAAVTPTIDGGAPGLFKPRRCSINLSGHDVNQAN